MSDRLSLSERSSSLGSQAIAFARASLRWIESVATKAGERDYETHMRGKVDSRILLATLLLESQNAVREKVASVSGDESVGLEEVPEGVSVALAALRSSEELLVDCESKRRYEEEARELLEVSCRTVSHLLSALHKTVSAMLLSEPLAISRRICSRVDT
jgi:hypothetical protein